MNRELYKEVEEVRKEYWLELWKLQPERGLKNVKKFRKKGMWALKNMNPKLHVSYGNAKLPKTTCIVNLGTWLNCSGRKEGFCEICKECYDKSPEVRFKERTKDRLEQEAFWRTLDAKTFGLILAREISNHNNKTKNKVNLIRWAEVGEIRNQEDLIKIRDVSNIIGGLLGIKSYIYTHNKNLDFDIDRPNLTINGSGFMVDNEYRVVKDREEEFNNLSDLSNKRDCVCDCTICSYCSRKDSFILIEELRL